MRHDDIHFIHDPTEGGLATGLSEIARAVDVGLIIEEEAIPFFPKCRTLCRHYGLNPLGLPSIEVFVYHIQETAQSSVYIERQ